MTIEEKEKALVDRLRGVNRPSVDKGKDPIEETSVSSRSLASLEKEIERFVAFHEGEMALLHKDISAKAAAAREEGWALGHEEGLAEGKVTGREEGLEEGLLRGKEEGLKEGLLRGKEEGYLRGKEEGFLRGKEEGLKEGEALGFEDGKLEGFALFKEKFLGSPYGQKFLEIIKDNLPKAFCKSHTFLNRILKPCQDFFMYGFRTALSQAAEKGSRVKGDVKKAWDNAPPLHGWEGDPSLPEDHPWWIEVFKEADDFLQSQTFLLADLEPAAEPAIPLRVAPLDASLVMDTLIHPPDQSLNEDVSMPILPTSAEIPLAPPPLEEVE